ncbi:IS481 family transposase [Cupriavidus nantongensis]|uniref:Transposase n=1 Tax=Cupriavidus nantongensis TaxID=1796606 RepID=A0A142JGK4_9BURK|nr:IS481 family transposase [Cupriavidus nantongensis]AMR77216.1 transposase [Cupriavidus nantongensis]
MPWSARDTMSLRLEFIALASQPGCNRRELCRRFSISPQTAYKWLARHRQEGAAGLADRPRRPHHSPERTADFVEELVLMLRREHPTWGGRKISRRLSDLGHAEVPAPSTVTSILHRHGLIDPQASAQATPWRRFEHDEPNELLQMDFKGQVPNEQGVCFPLTLIDDHSRFNLCLAACADQRRQTVQQQLIGAFRRYGLPRRITMDNGPPWGGGDEEGLGYTRLTVWLMQLGIRVSHSRPYHPQTQGKDERFHRTLKAEVLQHRRFVDNTEAQQVFDRYRYVYNHERPHQALGMQVPAQRYRVSNVAYPEALPEVQYQSGDRVYKVDSSARIMVGNRRIKIGKAFIGQWIALRPTRRDGVLAIWFSRFEIGEISLHAVAACRPQASPRDVTP